MVNNGVCDWGPDDCQKTCGLCDEEGSDSDSGKQSKLPIIYNSSDPFSYTMIQSDCQSDD